MGHLWRALEDWRNRQYDGEMTNSQLARQIGVTPQLVHKWSRGTHPDVENLRKIAARIGLSYDEVRTLALRDMGFLDDDEQLVITKVRRARAPSPRSSR